MYTDSLCSELPRILSERPNRSRILRQIHELLGYDPLCLRRSPRHASPEEDESLTIFGNVPERAPQPH